MKNSNRSIAGLILFAVMTATSTAEDAPKTPPTPMQGMGKHHGMGGMMSGMSEEQKDQHMRSMQEHMLKMHDLSNQILAEKDSAKKEQLKTQQLQLMKSHHAQMMESHQQMPMK